MPTGELVKDAVQQQPREKPIKRCSCGKEYTLWQYLELPLTEETRRRLGQDYPGHAFVDESGVDKEHPDLRFMQWWRLCRECGSSMLLEIPLHRVDRVIREHIDDVAFSPALGGVNGPGERR